MAEKKEPKPKKTPTLFKRDFESMQDLVDHVKSLKKKPHPFAVYIANQKIIDKTYP